MFRSVVLGKTDALSLSRINIDIHPFKCLRSEGAGEFMGIDFGVTAITNEMTYMILM